jgi:hypothetical protein
MRLPSAASTSLACRSVAQWTTASSAYAEARVMPTTAQYRHLMPQHQDLCVLGGVAARQKRQPAEHSDHEQVDEADQHERRA